MGIVGIEDAGLYFEQAELVLEGNVSQKERSVAEFMRERLRRIGSWGVRSNVNE